MATDLQQIQNMIQVTEEEWSISRCQIGTLNKYNRKYLPYAFTEQGVLTLIDGESYR